MTAPTARLRLRVAPGAKASTVAGRHGAAWKLRVVAAPERGRANDEVLALLAGTLRLPRSAVRLVSGAGSRDKVVELDGIDVEEAERRLGEAGGEA